MQLRVYDGSACWRSRYCAGNVLHSREQAARLGFAHAIQFRLQHERTSCKALAMPAMKLSRDCLWLSVIRPEGLSTLSLCLRRCDRTGALATGDKKGLYMAVFIAYAAGNRERI